MITIVDYTDYIGQTAPSNLNRLEFISLSTIKSIITKPIPDEESPFYEDFKKALMEQIRYYDLNQDLLESTGTGGYTLGSYSESANSKNETSKSIDRISPITYEILLNCGLIESPLGGCCLW